MKASADMGGGVGDGVAMGFAWLLPANVAFAGRSTKSPPPLHTTLHSRDTRETGVAHGLLMAVRRHEMETEYANRLEFHHPGSPQPPQVARHWRRRRPA